MNQKSLILCLLVVVIWGVNVVMIRASVAEIAPLTLLAIRFALTALVFAPFIQWPGHQQAWIIFQVGILMGVLHQGFLYGGLAYVDAGTMSILLQAQVIIVTLIGWLFLKETIRWRTWTGIALGIAGIVVLLGGPTLSAGGTLGFLYGILSALFIAVCYVRMKAIHNVKPLTFLALMNISSSLPMLMISYVASPDSWHTLSDHNWHLLGGILGIQVVFLSMTHVVWQKLLAQYPVSQVAPWTLLMPVFGVIFAYLLLGEPITWPMVAGGLLTIAGVGIITVRRIQKGVPLPAESLD